METPFDKRKIGAGGTYVVPGGVHLQAAPHGRRNLVLIIAPKGVPFVSSRQRAMDPHGLLRLSGITFDSVGQDAHVGAPSVASTLRTAGLGSADYRLKAVTGWR